VRFMQGEHLALPATLWLFEVPGGRPSRFWQARIHSEQILNLWLAELYPDNFHERQIDQKPELIGTYHDLCTRMEAKLDACDR